MNSPLHAHLSDGTHRIDMHDPRYHQSRNQIQIKSANHDNHLRHSLDLIKYPWNDELERVKAYLISRYKLDAMRVFDTPLGFVRQWRTIPNVAKSLFIAATNYSLTDKR